jgi:hypothetical protein
MARVPSAAGQSLGDVERDCGPKGVAVAGIDGYNGVWTMASGGVDRDRQNGCGSSQRITAGDVEAGIVRVPHDSKRCLPGIRTDVDTLLRGEALGNRRWDPRLGPDRERSGVLRVGRSALERHVQVGETLTICVDEQGHVRID